MFQKDVLDLFDSFKVKNKEAFYRLPPGEKPLFLGHLYKTFVRNVDDSLSNLKTTGGVKFHFETSGDLTTRHTNLPNGAFLKKTSFYANRSFITFPFQEIKNRKQLRILKDKPKHAWPKAYQAARKMMLFGHLKAGIRTGYGGIPGIAGKVYTIDSAAFDDMLTVFFRLKPAIKAGVAQILPSFPDTKKQFKNKNLGLTSANFKMPELQRQFYENEIDTPNFTREPSGLSHLLLPHFTNIPFERLLEIREKEIDLYWEFQRRLENMLRGASEIESEALILNYLRDVDSGVRELHRKFKDIHATYKRKNIYMLIKFLSVGLTMFAPLDAEVKKALATIIGGISAFDYLTTREDKAKAIYENRSNQFYLPWLVFKASEPYM
jgi:hypothetical protein